MWEDLPTAGNFKVARPGSRSTRSLASHLEVENRRKKYSKYLRCASECCGVKNSEISEMVEKSRSLGQHARETAMKELPLILRAMWRKHSRIELSYAVLRCRDECLRCAAMQQLLDLSADARGHTPAEELKHLLMLTRKERSEEKKHLAPRYTYRKSGALVVTGVHSEVWMFTEAARGSGAQDGWRALIIALKLRSIVALDVFPRIAPMGKDFEVFNIHEHMKAIGPEQRRVVKKDGQTSLRKNVRIPETAADEPLTV